MGIVYLVAINFAVAVAYEAARGGEVLACGL